LINDERSLNLAESKYFGLFINELNESYEILSYYMIKKNLKVKEKAENNISKILKDLEYVSVTTDSWKSNTKDNYYTLHIYHYDIKEKNHIKCRSLTAECLEEIHCRGEVLKELYEIFFDKYNIKSKIIASTTDGGTNIVKAFRMLNITNIHCSAHTLNIIVQGGFDELTEIFQKAKSLCSYFNESNVAWQTLKSYQEKDNQIIKEKNKEFSEVIYKLLQEMKVRWNTFYFCLERIDLLWNCIKKALLFLDKSDKFDDSDIEKIQQIIYILKPFYEGTLTLSSDTSTINIILPTFLTIKKKLGLFEKSNFDEINNFFDKIMKNLDIQINLYLDNETILIATFLDIRFKSLNFLNQDKKIRIYELIKSFITDIGNENTIISSNNENSFFEDFIDSKTTNENNEIENYLNESHSYNNFIPLQWWTNKKLDYPNLFNLAIKYLIIPASSTIDERENSQLGRLITKLRNRLHPETASMLSFLKNNDDLW
jgi:uncharacterized protein YqgV (UPF0045/DUF77 family)